VSPLAARAVGVAIWLVTVVVLSTCFSPSAMAAPTEADLERASAEFQRGKAAFARKEYVEAARAFDAAHAAVPDAGAAFNAGLAWQSAKEPARAADAYVASLETPGLDGVRAGDAKRALKRIEAKLPRLVVRTSAPARVAIAYRNEPAPVVVHLEAGRYEVVAVFDDGTRASKIVEVRGPPTLVNVDKPSPFPPSTDPTPPLRPEARPEAPPPVEVPEPSQDAGRTQRIVGIVSLGLGAAGGATAIALGALGLQARDEFDASNREDTALHDEAVALRTGTNIAWAVAGAFTLTGIIVIATSFGDDEPAAVAGPCVSPALTGLCGTF
jgi:tetratricopeptide (TPR) repeat protein